MNNKEILLNAPEGATHFDGNTYFRFEMYEHGQAYLVHKKGCWGRGLPAYPVYGCRSLADIRRIVELEEENERLRDKLRQVDGALMRSVRGFKDG